MLCTSSKADISREVVQAVRETIGMHHDLFCWWYYLRWCCGGVIIMLVGDVDGGLKYACGGFNSRREDFVGYVHGGMSSMV